MFSCGDDPKTLEGAASTIFDGECVNETDEKIIVYSGRSENLILPVIEAFVCETGIKVDTRWGSSTDIALLIDEEGCVTISSLDNVGVTALRLEIVRRCKANMSSDPLTLPEGWHRQS